MTGVMLYSRKEFLLWSGPHDLNKEIDNQKGESGNYNVQDAFVHCAKLTYSRSKLYIRDN